MRRGLQNHSNGWRKQVSLGLLLVIYFASPAHGAVTATVNRDTGNLTVSNGGPGPLAFFGYTVSSQFGALSATNWLTIADHYDRNAPPTPGNGSIDANDSWSILSGPASRTELSEAELSIPAGNGGMLAVGNSLDLGNVWTKSPTEDVVLRVLRADDNVVNVMLTFTGNGGAKFQPGDMNFNGTLDPADWNIYIAGTLTNLSGLSGAERYQKGDLNDDGANNLTDMDLFIDAYDAANGLGAFVQMLAGIPEPASCLLLVFGGIWLVQFRFGRRRTPPRVIVAAAIMLLALSATPTIAVSLDPVATSGHDQDIIFESGLASGQVGANGELGSRQFFEDGATSPTDNGLLRVLPPFTAASGNTINFEFQPFEQNNILKFSAGTPTKSLAMVAPKPYSHLAIAFSGGALQISPLEVAVLPYTINYQSGATQTGSLNVPDWGPVPILPSGTERLFTADRTDVNETTWPIQPEGTMTTTRWATYISEITPNFTEPITSISFHTPTLNGGALNSGDDVVVFGLAGAAVTGPTTLNLFVNTTSGRLLIHNPTANAISLTAYEISSDDGSLNVAGWMSLSDQNLDPVGNGPGETWDEAPGSSNSALLEGRLFGSTTIAPGGTPLDLGLAFNPSGEHDLVFRQRNAAGIVVAGTVSYAASSGVTGDYNDDGVVNAADYVVWRENNNTSIVLPNDSSPSGVSDADYLVWKANFGRTLGGGAAIGFSAAVPEPGVLFLAFAALIGVAAHDPRYRRHN